MTQRLPALLWLLLAATICVDGVATVWMFEEHLSTATATLFVALVSGQVSALCISVVMRRSGGRLAWILPFAFSTFAALLMTIANVRFSDGFLSEIVAFMGLMWLHPAIALPALWLLKPTTVFRAMRAEAAGARWQFSILHLLIVMTCVAVLSAVLNGSELSAQSVVSVFTLALINTALLIGVLLAARPKWHVLQRLAAVSATAIGIGLFCEATQIAFADKLYFVAYALIQALTVWSWVELMRPESSDAVSPDAEPTAREETP
jgi:hypothetical protein